MNVFSKKTLKVCFALAVVLTFSCSGGEDNPNKQEILSSPSKVSSSSSYKVPTCEDTNTCPSSSSETLSSNSNIMTYCVVGNSCYEMSLYDCVNYYSGTAVNACPVSSSSSATLITEFCLIGGDCYEIMSYDVNQNCSSYGGIQVANCLASSSSSSAGSLTGSSSSSVLATYTLITNIPNGGGTVSRSPSSSSYTAGTIVTLTATPSAGYKFIRWSGALISTEQSVQVTMDENKILIAEFEQLYTLTISATPAAGGTVLKSPSASSYTEGTTVAVTATPSAGYRFVKWSGASTVTHQSVMITMDGNKTLTAEFEQLTYTLTTSASSGGTVSRTPSSSSYTHGTTVTVTATPSAGYKFVRWSGSSAATTTSVTITMDGNKTLTAEFEPLTYTLTISASSGGTVSRTPSSSSYTEGTIVTVTATPNTGYVFVKWSGASTSTNTSVTITMDENKTLTAQFTKIATYTLTTAATPTVGGTTSISPSSSSYTEGTTVTVTAIPITGYRFVKWSGASTSTNSSVQITMDGNKTMTAEFEWNGETFTDSRDSKIYKYVTIGEQTWMAENLNYNVSGSLCYSGTSSCNIYGRLYEWSTAMDFERSCNYSNCNSQINATHNGICPQGWHIPSNKEFQDLFSYVASQNGIEKGSPGYYSDVSKYLKTIDGWLTNAGTSSPDVNGTDNYGFAALSGGYLKSNCNGTCSLTQQYTGNFAGWWASDASTIDYSYAEALHIYYSIETRIDFESKMSMLSVRCVKD